jgi:cytochrome c biogenesis protein CcdA
LIILISSIIGIINAILWGLIMMNLGKQFMTAEETGRAYVAIILMVLGSVVSMVIMMYIFSTTTLITINTSSYMSYIGGIFSIIGYLLYYQIYKNILGRFISGQIRPPAPPTVNYPAGPVPMGPVYGPPPGYPPTYPI